MKTNRKPLKDDLKGPAFLVGLFRNVNQMARMINGLSILSGGDVILDPDGILLRIPGKVTPPHPWKTSRADDGEIKRIRVHPGAIDGLMPTNMFSHFTISGSGVEYLVLSVLASSGTLVSCSLSVEAAQPSVPVSTEDSPPDTLYDVIAVLHDGQIYQVRSRNLSATSQLVAEVPALIAEPWRDNLKRFYRWSIAEAA